MIRPNRIAQPGPVARPRAARSGLVRLLWSAALLTFAAGTTGGPAGAQVAFPSRTSSTLIRTTAKDFSDATATIAATTQVAKGSTGTRDLDYYTSSNLVSSRTAASGDVAAAVDIVDRNDFDGYAELAGTVAATGPGGGSFTVFENFSLGGEGPYGFGPLYHYADGSAFHDPDNDFLPAFTQTALPVLELFLPIGGAGLVDQSGVFEADLTIAGDWSTTGGLGSGTGQHYLAHLNPAWRITQDFVYDKATNLTTFRAVNPAYDYADPDPFGLELDVFFIGKGADTVAAAVPEPATWGLAILGLGLAGAALRGRRRGGIAAAALG